MTSLARLLSASRVAVFFGGAGVSVASGIPDFRSSAGLYARTHRGLPPEHLLSHDCLVDDAASFFDFHRTALCHPDARPNEAHRALARLEAAGRLAAVVTQNIDGLHQAAGSQVVHELHGSARRNTCTACGRTYPMEWMLATTGVPACDDCGAMVRPDVVLYGEALDEQVVQAAVAAIGAADLVVVGGTSLTVHPAAGLLQFAHCPVVLVNRDATPFDEQAAVVVREPVEVALAAAADEVLGG